MNLKKILTQIIILLILCFTSNAIATGSAMLPLKSELLNDPVEMTDCPVTIVEWRGDNALDPNRVEKLNDYCKLVIDKFDIFINEKGIKKYNTIPFGNTWNVSIIPEDSKYRSLNDAKYRFKERWNNNATYWGYTNNNRQYIFLANEATMPFWAHELFHALSFHYFIYINHANTDEKRLAIEEALAKEFTVWLGLGPT